MDRFLIESLRMANGLIAIGIVLAFGLAALVVPVPGMIPLPLAFALGAALGLAVAVLFCGSAATLLAIHDRLGAGAGIAAIGVGMPATAATAAAANGSQLVANGADNDSAAVDPITGLPVSPDLNILPPEVIELLNTGQFAEFHLAKARIAFANRDFKKAKYEVAASMCHDSSNPAARELRTQIRAAR